MKQLIALAIIYFCRCLPIKKNKLFMFSYYGSNYGCNPKYITEYLVTHYPKGRFDVVWAFNDPNSKHLPTPIRKVKTMSFRYFYELCTAKVVITNYRTTELFVKRKNQYYIQTWHSSLRLKQIEKDAEDVLPDSYVQMARKDSMKCDLLLSGCKYSTNIFKRSFWFDGEIFEQGIPRNDMLIQHKSDDMGEIKRKLNIPKDKKILLYAPTFRKHNNLEVYDLDWTQLLNRLKNKFGSEWVILVKLHPHLISKSSQLINGNQHVKDVTSYEDIQELLFTADVLISDYSSLMFDFSITKRPCFLYVPDIHEYTKQDRKLYFDITDLPFISATSNSDLFDKIGNFHNRNYQDNLAKFLNRVGSYEEGRASEHLLKRIEAVCFNDKRSEMYEAV
ncbi:glycerophosphotransferase [Virgibacillus profundi]|uniref:Glycerophosphotransferase n=2 Tax=Virgibacillus profundi TaxID=2024555 RepID=A0A2A2II59_9BACI|nr:glycerophosphotransferase [Virgibacillus profundi]PXY55877.1 glycerophosphotransferase [Virgibacillus profundi]